MAISEHQAGDGSVRTSVEARQGIKTRHVRWVLAISLVLGIVTLSCAWIGYAIVGGQGAPPAAEGQR